MQRFFFRNLAFLITVNLVVKPFWLFGIDRSVQNLVAAENYGLYFVLLNLSMLTMILLDLGISSYNNKTVAGNQALLTTHLPHLLTLKLALAVLYFLVTLGAALVLGYSHRAVNLLAWITANQVMAGLIMFFRSNVNALHRFVADSIFSVLDKALVILICGLLLWVPAWRTQFTIEWFVYAQFAAYTLSLTGIVIYLWNIAGALRIMFPDRFTLHLMRQAAPFALLIFLMTLYARIDAVMLKQLLGTSGKIAAGIYAAGYRILDALNQVGYLFSVLLLPLFSRLIAGNKSVTALVRSSSVVLYLFSVTAATGIAVFSDEITAWLYREHVRESSVVLRWLIFALVGHSFTYVFSTLLTAAGKLCLLTGIATLGALLNILLNVTLIPAYQAAGAAAAAALTINTVAAAQFGFAFRHFGFSLNGALFLRLVLYTLCCALAFVLLQGLPLHAAAALPLGGLLCLLLAFALRLLHLSELLRLRAEN